MHDIANRQTLIDLCEQREQCVALIEHGAKALHEAGKILPGRYGLAVEIEHRRDMAGTLREVDRQFWRHALDLTGFRQIMDAAALSEWQRELDGPKCPAFTMDTVISTFLTASQQAGDMFDRGVFRVFRGLDGAYRSNERDAFKIIAGQRYVLAHWCDNWGGLRVHPQLSHRRGSGIDDIDRVVRVVRGEKFEPRALEMAMNAAFEQGTDYQCDVYKARAFRNGNLHLWIQDAAAVDKINEAIARHAGGDAIPRQR